MKNLIKTAISVLCFLCAGVVFAQDYSGTWYRHNDLISDDTFILLDKVNDGKYTGKLVWNGHSYTFRSTQLYKPYGKEYWIMPITISYDYKTNVYAEINLYPIELNRIDFICKYKFSSLYDLYCTEIATAQAWADLKRQQGYREAKEVAISALRALAYGDVPTLKRCYSIDAYKKFFPYSDSYTRQSLLNVPVERRKRLIEHVNNAEITTIPNNAGDVVTFIFTNTTTGEIITLQLFDERMNNNWKIIELTY